MCRYTAELVTMLDPGWVTVLGLVDGDTHAWNERRGDGSFCDLTGDQFARPAVQLRVGRPLGYVEHRWTGSSPAVFRSRATEWLRKIGPVEAYSISSDTPEPVRCQPPPSSAGIPVEAPTWRIGTAAATGRPDGQS
ncbi:hypothetical protein [Pseudonocardia kunmingensis]|uniref:Uncharacterized protein n=1 Tax=Pseudonocardia kunmingensis TaxID=630975 RepID=A0A543CXE2_9PSEU|nr:hypothetical protein [Pseudonocardia kunmingensis]TQM01709.1 hypothetical protein FB558_8611 [Pseudonocardia kunmingensis]